MAWTSGHGGELVAVFGAAERRWLIGWSVTLYERGRSHYVGW